MQMPTDPDIFISMIDGDDLQGELLEELEKHFIHLTEDQLTSSQILEVLEAHNHDKYGCAYCYFLISKKYWMTVEVLIHKQLANFTSQIIDKCFDVMETHYAYTDNEAVWLNGDSDKPERMHVDLALHPDSSEAQLRSGASFFGFVEAAELYEEMELTPETYFLSVLKRVASHPKTSRDIFSSWLEAGHEARSGDGRVEADGLHESDIEDCSICKEHEENAWPI